MPNIFYGQPQQLQHPYFAQRPVGGHCIGVDPYYLTYRAEQMGYHSQVILAGRRINTGNYFFYVVQFMLSIAGIDAFRRITDHKVYSTFQA